MTDQASTTRWSRWRFQTTLLPGTELVSVHVSERFDIARAARHEQIRRDHRDGTIRALLGSSCCPGCGDDLLDAAEQERARVEGTGPARDDPARPGRRPDLARVLMTQVAEVISGWRPSSQLAAVVDPRVLRYIRIETERARTGEPFTLWQIHVQQNDDRAAELYGLLAVGQRRLGYCARLEATAHGWRLMMLRLLHSNTAGPRPGVATAPGAAPHPAQR